jgi:hypothetical protein
MTTSSAQISERHVVDLSDFYAIVADCRTRVHAPQRRPLIRKQSQGAYAPPAVAFGASSTHWQRLKPRFAAFWAIEITTEFLLVGMATTAETFVFRCSVIVVHNYPNRYPSCTFGHN